MRLDTSGNSTSSPVSEDGLTFLVMADDLAGQRMVFILIADLQRQVEDAPAYGLNQFSPQIGKLLEQHRPSMRRVKRNKIWRRCGYHHKERRVDPQSWSANRGVGRQEGSSTEYHPAWNRSNDAALFSLVDDPRFCAKPACSIIAG
ncbi:unnamed protein product [Rhizoctonia solani]|uniref:Uncharacterized protein n=1 Tax=Rhizoctonia solani TaxID=456999 RepID=A0A8H3DDY5_9AGAM|nr:unnamed protein product [Rhizoctonia solani]